MEDKSDKPGFHYVDQDKFSIDQASPVHARKGDIVIFSYLLVHGSYVNRCLSFCFSKNFNDWFFINLLILNTGPIECEGCVWYSWHLLRTKQKHPNIGHHVVVLYCEEETLIMKLIWKKGTNSKINNLYFEVDRKGFDFGIFDDFLLN